MNMKQLIYSIFDGECLKQQCEKDCRINFKSYEYSILINAYIEVNGDKNYIFGKKSNSQPLCSLNSFTEEQLQEIANKYHLKLSYENETYYIHIYGRAYKSLIIKNEKYDILYAIGGDRSPEYIYIYGVFEKE